MLRLTGAFRYFFCSDVVSFKCRHNGLASYIKCSLHRDPSNGDIYIFMSKDQRKLRVFYYHHRGFILTEKVLSEGKFLRPIYDETAKCYRMSWPRRYSFSLNEMERMKLDSRRKGLDSITVGGR